MNTFLPIIFLKSGNQIVHSIIFSDTRWNAFAQLKEKIEPDLIKDIDYIRIYQDTETYSDYLIKKIV